MLFGLSKGTVSGFCTTVEIPTGHVSREGLVYDWSPRSAAPDRGDQTAATCI